MKKVLLTIALIWIAGFCFFALKAQAAEINLTVDSSDGSDGATLTDNDVRTFESFEEGTTLTFESPETIDSLYIKWDAVPSPAKLKDGEQEVTVGEKGFLHEYVKLSGTGKKVTLTVPKEGCTIADIFAFSAGDLPDFVQQWHEPYDRADILFISTHSDDEVLFFGGMIPIYTNENRARVQVAYFTDFFQTESYRNHELLDGIWTMGVDHYPQLGKFYDHYSESLEEAEEQFEHDECLDYIVEVIRRFKPQVLVSHDEEGEYGHGGHRYVSKLVKEAVEITADETKSPKSAETYGAWDVPKTYLHLYKENPIEMKTREPLSGFGGKNALEIAKEAYQKHESQQWMWFYVDDGYDENGNPNEYEYSCAKYGLFRTTVGADFSGDDVLDNIITYADQEKKAEEESKRQEETTEHPEKEAETDKHVSKALIIILIAIAVLVVLLIIFYAVMQRRKRRRAEEARRARARRARAERTQPERRTEPAERRQQVRPEQPVRRSQPAERTQQARPEQPVRRSQPAERTQQARPEQPVRRQQPAERVQQTRPEQPVRRQQPAERVQQVRPEQPVRRTQPTERTQQARPEQPVRRSQPAERVQQTRPEQPVRRTQPAERVQQVRPEQPVRRAQPSGSSRYAEREESLRKTQSLGKKPARPEGSTVQRNGQRSSSNTERNGRR